MAGSVVVGYDDSPAARAALEEAVVLAERFGYRLVIGFGVEPPGGVGEEYRAHLEALEEIGRQATERARERASQAGVEAHVELVPERAAAALIALAKEHEGRYIVVGSHGEGPLRGALLGSTPHKLVQLSSTPVLVVRGGTSS